MTQKKVSLLVFFLALGTAGFWLLRKPLSQSVQLDSAADGTEVTNSEITLPSISPYDELTIPYMRSREYVSQLGELDLLNASSQYQSFLTSYVSDGLKIEALITQPTGEMPATGWPAIVFVHGYIPPTLYKTTERYTGYVDALARSGFVVFKIDLRGHGNSEGEAGGAYYSSDYIIDTLNARSALQKSGFVNPDKIGLWGHSMAGNVVIRSVAVQPEIPAAVIWAGAVYSYQDMQKYGLNDNSYRPPGQSTNRQRRRQMLFDQFGEFDSSSDFWKQVAPTNYLRDVATAIQLHHAENDSVVNIGYSRDLSALLDVIGKPHQFFEYQTGGHDIEGNSFSLAMERTIAFFKLHLTE